MDEIFYDIFSDLPRQGPGNKMSTIKALQLLEQLPVNPKVVDIGCGTGSQTLCLAEQIGGSIMAIDNHQPYLDQLKKESDRLGFDNIECRNEDMFKLNFEDESLDLIWSEGAAYVMGFENSLNKWNPFLRKGGYLAVSEVCLLRDDLPQELEEFWNREYPDIKSVKNNLLLIDQSQFQLIDFFTLPPTAWWDDFYTPLENRLELMRTKYIEQEDAMDLIDMVQNEINLYKKYPDYYSYVFFIMQK